LLAAGKDFQSDDFKNLVNLKLAELRAPPLSGQSRSFGLTVDRRKQLDGQIRRELQAVVRVDEEPFDLDATLERFNQLWWGD
jgi:hypothetical protein